MLTCLSAISTSQKTEVWSRAEAEDKIAYDLSSHFGHMKTMN